MSLVEGVEPLTHPELLEAAGKAVIGSPFTQHEARRILVTALDLFAQVSSYRRKLQ